MTTHSELGTDSDPIYAGETKTLHVTILDAAGDAKNVTGWALSMVFGNDLVVLTTGGGEIVLTTPASGIIDATLSRAHTLRLGGRRTPYKLWRTDAGYEAVLAEDTIWVRP